MNKSLPANTAEGKVFLSHEQAFLTSGREYHPITSGHSEFHMLLHIASTILVFNNESSESLKSIVSSRDSGRTICVVTFKLLMGNVTSRLMNITKRNTNFSAFKKVFEYFLRELF